MKKFLRGVAIASTVTMLFTLLAACGENSANKEEKTTQTTQEQQGTQESSLSTETKIPEKFENLVVIFPGDETPEFTAFVKGDYAKRLKDELNMALDYSFVPWDQYDNKINLAISSGERLDWVWNGLSVVGNYYSKKMIQPIDDLLNQYGSDIKKVNPVDGYKSAIFDGKNFGDSYECCSCQHVL